MRAGSVAWWPTWLLPYLVLAANSQMQLPCPRRSKGLRAERLGWSRHLSTSSLCVSAGRDAHRQPGSGCGVILADTGLPRPPPWAVRLSCRLAHLCPSVSPLCIHRPSGGTHYHSQRQILPRTELGTSLAAHQQLSNVRHAGWHPAHPVLAGAPGKLERRTCPMVSGRDKRRERHLSTQQRVTLAAGRPGGHSCVWL